MNTSGCGVAMAPRFQSIPIHFGLHGRNDEDLFIETSTALMMTDDDNDMSLSNCVFLDKFVESILDITKIQENLTSTTYYNDGGITMHKPHLNNRNCLCTTGIAAIVADIFGYDPLSR